MSFCVLPIRDSPVRWSNNRELFALNVQVVRLTTDNRPWTIIHGLLFLQMFLYTQPYSTPNGEPLDKRVKFDFEIDFSNGGGLQGQDFRLDIEGDDISDQELADYIVRDMRLLMVKEVRILKKEIITEKHKRQQDQSLIS